MTILDEVYEDHELVEWVENASRETLELHYMELVARYRGKCRELRTMRNIASYEIERRQARDDQLDSDAYLIYLEKQP